ncbi:MAG: hypothetical protein R3E96_05160 [Planctomycetota bacterium]
MVATFALIFLLDGGHTSRCQVTGNQNFGLLSPNRNFFEIASTCSTSRTSATSCCRPHGEDMESLAVEHRRQLLGPRPDDAARPVRVSNVRKMEVIA